MKRFITLLLISTMFFPLLAEERNIELQWKYNINSEFDTVKENSYSTAEYLLMNWGYDGDNNDGLFSTYPSSIWKYYDRNYQYDKEIYYDFK